MWNKFIVTVFITILFISGLYIVLIKDKPEISIAENRPLATLSRLNYDNWMNNEFQESLESVLADHFIKRSAWVSAYQKTQISLNRSGQKIHRSIIGLLSSPQEITNNKTISNDTGSTNPSQPVESQTTKETLPSPVETTTGQITSESQENDSQFQENYEEDQFSDSYDSNRNDVSLIVLNNEINLATLNGEDRLIHAKRNYDAAALDRLTKNVSVINKLPEDIAPSSVYVYLVATPQDSAIVYPDQNFLTALPYIEGLQVPYDYFYLPNVADIQRYFYRTDHHWNHMGAYRGYRDIIKLLMGSNEKIYKPVDISCFGDVEFRGSFSRQIGFTDGLPADQICKLYFRLPEYQLTVNGSVQSEYGHLSEYQKGKVSKELGFDHYNYLYQSRQAIIEFDTGRNELDNLLVISDSMSNPNRDLIAGHFNKSYFLNMEQYNEAHGMLDLEDFVKEYDIDKTLFYVTIDSLLPNGEFKYIKAFK